MAYGFTTGTTSAGTASRIGLYIDCEELSDIVKEFEGVLTEGTIRKCYRNAARRTVAHARKELYGISVKPFYTVPYGFFKSSMKRAETYFDQGGGGVTVKMPLDKERGKNGQDKIYKHLFGKKPGRIGFKTALDSAPLPSAPGNYGGNKVFRPTTKGQNKGRLTKPGIYVRKGWNRYPLVRIPGISPVQMPLNRGADAAVNDLQPFFLARLEHELMYAARFLF